MNCVDKLFDMLNSRSLRATGFKRAINATNAHYIISSLKSSRQFLLALQDSNGKPITDTRRRTCIIGFCATIDSVIYLIEKLILNDKDVNGVRMKYLLTHRLSQDHAETFFSIVRRRGGWNNNPTAL